MRVLARSSVRKKFLTGSHTHVPEVNDVFDCCTWSKVISFTFHHVCTNSIAAVSSRTLSVALQAPVGLNEV